MKKKSIQVSDAIPQRPASFDDTVERTLESVCRQQQKQEQKKETPSREWKIETGEQRKRGSRRSVIDYVIGAAAIVVCVAIIGGAIAFGPRMRRNASSEPIEAAQPIETVETVKTVSVSTVDEFLAAIAPDTRIVLADGTYNLADAADYGTAGKRYYTWVDRSDNWFREEEENSFELSLRNVNNLTVTGSKNAEIVTVPRTAAVLSVRNCQGLTLSGFTAGHTVASDPCEGEVVRLVECADARIENCSLYGCGTWGVNAVDCDDFVLSGTDIYECSDGGVMFVRCRNALMTECKVRNCGYRDDAFSLFYVFDCQNLKITACDVYENRTETVFNLVDDGVEGGSENVFLLGTSVHDNTVLGEVFHSNTETGPFVAGCEFRNNDGVLLPDDQHVYGLDGNRLTEADLLAMQLDRTVDVDLGALPTPEPQEPTPEPTILVPAVMYDGTLYVLTDRALPGEPADGAVVGTIEKVVTDPTPKENLEANFGEVGMPLALTSDGLVILYEYEWCLLEPKTTAEAEPAFDALCLFFDTDLNYAPFENWIWSDQDDGLAADGMSFVDKIEEVKDKIPTIYNPGILSVKAGDGVQLEPNVTIYNAELNTVAFGSVLSEAGTFDPGTYYVSQRVSRRETDRTSGYECVVRIVIEAETVEELLQDPTAFPGLFRFWDYDTENGYREAPKEGVLFICDFDGDGKEEEIRYEIHGSFLTISVGKKSVELSYGAGLEQAILLDLDPDSARLNLLVVYNTGSEDYETAEFHMENGKLVSGPVIFAYCNYDGKTLLGSASQTDILGTRFGERSYHGEDLTPDSEWFVCDVIPDYIPTARDREQLIENGKLLHLIRDLPCTIDGEDAAIPADSYVYMTRWHESGTLAEIRTEDGTITALVRLQEADPDDPELYGYLIDGEMQDMYFDNIFYAD